MTQLTQISHEERRRIVEPFLDEVLADLDATAGSGAPYELRRTGAIVGTGSVVRKSTMMHSAGFSTRSPCDQ